MPVTPRFAPSPTGPLHLGHAFSALMAHDMAMVNGGRFLLRIEDIDRQRSKPQWEQQILDDLEWLGLTWETPVMRQSDRLPAYRTALQRLWKGGWLYPCTCTRRDIAQAASAPQERDPIHGPDGLIYPGTCRSWHDATGAAYSSIPMPEQTALRLHMGPAARAVCDSRIDRPGGGTTMASFHEITDIQTLETRTVTFTPEELVREVGDVVLSRKDFLGSYHLSVVLDDAAQGITHVVRGQDLFEATKIHVVLQRLLGLATPDYHHHRLIRDDQGKRLAKRDDARAIAAYRADGATPSDIRRIVGL